MKKQNELTGAQLRQLLWYCEQIEGDGIFYGNKRHFDNRANAIQAWIACESESKKPQHFHVGLRADRVHPILF